MRLGGTRSDLWRNHDFLRLWTAESVSQVGSQVTLVALPLAAALELDASPLQMGILTAMGTLPFLLLGLFAGVWVDRLRRKPILVITDFGRALTLLIIPLAWWLDLLRIELLYVVAALAGVQALFYEVAWVSFLPAVVRRDQLVEGNAKLHGSASVAQVAGPGAAGLLVGLAGAPLALLVDAGSFLISALTVQRIRTPEPAPERQLEQHVVREIVEGVVVVVRDRSLRAMALSAATVGFFGWLFLAVYVLYMIDDLGFSSTQVGLVFSLGGLGAVLGAALAEPIRRRLGIGPAAVLGRTLFGVFGLLVPLAVSLPSLEVPMVLAAEFLQWMTLTVAAVNQVSLRQALAPERMLGRVTATMRLMNTGLVPLGSLAGGLLGELVGLRSTLVVGAVGMLFAGAFLWFSPLRTLRDVPDSRDAEPERATELTGGAAGV